MNTGAAAKYSPRILCISPLFVPMADSEAFCGAKMVQALMRCGASVTVLSCRDFRERPSDGSELWNSLNEVDVEVPLPRPPNPLHSIISATRFQTPFHARWVSAAVHKAKLLHSESGFDLIYTRSIPIAAHIAGFWCAKALKLPWIANINDPWASEFFPLVENQKLSAFGTAANIFWLRRTMRNADLVTFPCRRLRDFHLRLARLDQAAEVFPHIGSKPERASKNPSGHFRLVHTGKLLSSEGRLGKGILLGLKAFLGTSADAASETKLILVGPGDEETQSMISEMGLQRNVEFVGRVNYEDSLDYIASSSVCVLIESRMNEGIFFPSKLADYLANGKPVLAVGPKIGTAADLASRGELIRVDHDPDAVRDAIAMLYSQYKRGTLASRNPSDQLQAQLQGNTVADRFLSRCQALTSTRSDGRAARLERIHQQGPLTEQFF